MGSLFIEASAKTAVGVRQVFLDLVEKVVRAILRQIMFILTHPLNS